LLRHPDSRPLDIHGVRAFVGMINYYGRFINNVSSLLEPMYRLLKKGQTFKWTDKCEVAFNKAKQMVASENVFIHYDPSLELRLNCDASNIGIGAVLSSILPDGIERPITFISKILSDAELNYSVVVKEALAIYWAVKKLSQYLQTF